MPFTIDTLLQRGTASGSRSTVLNPLGWLFGLCAPASISAYWVGVDWLGAVFGILAAATVGVYLLAYGYFVFVDKDALRSERFVIQKMAIESQLIGDDQVGVIQLATGSPKLLPGESLADEGKES